MQIVPSTRSSTRGQADSPRPLPRPAPRYWPPNPDQGWGRPANLLHPLSPAGWAQPHLFTNSCTGALGKIYSPSDQRHSDSWSSALVYCVPLFIRILRRFHVRADHGPSTAPGTGDSGQKFMGGSSPRAAGPSRGGRCLMPGGRLTCWIPRPNPSPFTPALVRQSGG